MGDLMLDGLTSRVLSEGEIKKELRKERKKMLGDDPNLEVLACPWCHTSDITWTEGGNYYCNTCCKIFYLN